MKPTNERAILYKIGCDISDLLDLATEYYEMGKDAPDAIVAGLCHKAGAEIWLYDRRDYLRLIWARPDWINKERKGGKNGK